MGLALAIQPLPVPAEAKFVALLAAGVAGSFGLAALVSRAGPVARVIGSRRRSRDELDLVGRSYLTRPTALGAAPGIDLQEARWRS